MALTRVIAPNFLKIKKYLTPIRPVSISPIASRSFNTNVQAQDSGDDDRSIAFKKPSDQSIARRRESLPPGFFSEVFDPFSPATSLSQVLNWMDQLIDFPFVSGPGGGVGSGLRRGWDAKEDENCLYLRIEMPGLSKDDVKVTVEQNTLIIKGEDKDKDSDDEEGGRRYSSRIEIPPNLYKLDEIKAEMKNGVLKITLPKVKEEERQGGFEVKVEG